MKGSRLDFVLPGTWWRLPLNDAEGATEAAIRTILDTSVGRRDEDAHLRREIRTSMRDLIATGREVQAEQIHFAKDLVGALPFPVSLMISWPDFPVTPRGTTGERAQIVAAAVPESLPTEILDLPQLSAVRTIAVRPGQFDDEGEPVDLPHLDVNYWLAVDGVEEIAVFGFTTVLVSLQEEIVDLFDAIIGTVDRPGAPNPRTR